MNVLLYEGPGAEPLGEENRLELLDTLLEAGCIVTPVSCMCEAPDPDAGGLVVLARFEPATRAQITGGAMPGVHAIDLDGLTPTGAVERIRQAAGELDAPAPGEGPNWFPVIDYDRCTHCGQCMDFCLFSVYAVTADAKIEVAQPGNCKPNCPACARICPTGAILFPKHPDAPINGQDADQPATAPDLRETLRGDVYRVLQERNRGGGPRLNRPDRDPQRALAEREACACHGRLLNMLGGEGADPQANNIQAAQQVVDRAARRQDSQEPE